MSNRVLKIVFRNSEGKKIEKKNTWGCGSNRLQMDKKKKVKKNKWDTKKNLTCSRRNRWRSLDMTEQMTKKTEKVTSPFQDALTTKAGFVSLQTSQTGMNVQQWCPLIMSWRTTSPWTRGATCQDGKNGDQILSCCFRGRPTTYLWTTPSCHSCLEGVGRPQNLQVWNLHPHADQDASWQDADMESRRSDVCCCRARGKMLERGRNAVRDPAEGEDLGLSSRTTRRSSGSSWNSSLKNQLLFERILTVPDPQSAWLSLFNCATTRANVCFSDIQPDGNRRLTGDSKTRTPGWLWPKKYTKIDWNDRVAAGRTSSCSSRRTTSTRSSSSSWTVIEAKLGSSWSSWEKSQWNGRIEEISGFYTRHNCKKKIGRRSRYYPWTHWQDTGIANWNSRCWISTHVTSQPVSFPPHPVPGGMPSRSVGMPSRKDGPPSIWDTHGISGNVFASPVASSTAPCPKELNPWSSQKSEPIHSSTAEKNENQTPVQDQRCQSGQPAKNSVIPSERGFSKN